MLQILQSKPKTCKNNSTKNQNHQTSNGHALKWMNRASRADQMQKLQLNMKIDTKNDDQG